MHISRRASLATIASTAAAAALARTATARDDQKSPAGPAAAPQGAGYYRFNVGELECFSIGEGGMPGQGSAYPTFGKNASQKDVDELTAANFIPAKGGYSYFNILAVRSGARTALVDVGFGGLAGERAGWLRKGLAAAGINPGDVTDIILSHLHFDHIGLLSSPDNPFTNAKFYVNEAEKKFWSGEKPDLTKMGIDEAARTQMTGVAKGALANISSKLVDVADGAEIVPGVKVVHAPGHTPGHQMVEVTSAGERLVHIVDLAHHFAISFQRPQWHVAFDTDPEQAVNMRRKVMGALAAERTRVMGYHTPWPGLGNVVAHADAFAWVAEPWRW